ncbi:MAG TPA: hypothetical protein VHZ81_03635 [Galbitalea sp.]|jgi:hypothetical protein|nr:hypothetical protein [Galbitalea sp.]
MTDPITSPLTLVGDPSAAVCEGEFCEIPDHHEQAIINRRLDEDAV